MTVCAYVFTEANCLPGLKLNINTELIETTTNRIKKWLESV
jgi:hypothetical protein